MITLTGSLVASPSTANRSRSATLLLQVGDRTVMVHLTGRTQLVNRDSAPIGRGDLHDGAVLRVTGSYNGVKVNASRVQDLSLPALTVTVQGQLAAAPSPAVPPAGTLCLANAAVTGVSLPQALVPAAGPCAAGQLPVYLTSSTKITSRSGGAVSLADLKANDTLRVTATLDNGKLLASLVVDMSR
jgi:hypothetical protein